MVRSFLNLLEKLSMVERKTTNKTTILTICNYDKYQCEQQTDNKRITNGKQTDNKRITTNKNEKNEKNEKKKNIYSNFYDSEIEKNEAAPNLEFYKKFVKTIYGENDINRELTEILQFKEQLTFQQFEKIYKLRAENKKSIQETLLKIANDSKYWKGKSNLYMTLRNWLTGRFEK
jgi:hypothetical protein